MRRHTPTQSAHERPHQARNAHADRTKDNDEKETGRVEAFSDGVFAIAITLLILDIKVPHPQELGTQTLLTALQQQWPTFLAYFTSFATILVMWVNHHRVFTHIRRTNTPFMFLNGLLLLCVSFVPFPTALIAEYIRHPQAKTASVAFAGTYLVIALTFNLLWRYASQGGRLLNKNANWEEVRAITQQYVFGPPLYLATFVVSFFSVYLSVGMGLFLALFFAFTGSLQPYLPGRRN
ncbi:MAG TPA: TMEM175 family protein [Chthonomonadaceae bacterium]|nr:TMEM175 family protein [Chthonomonadaceae bacterium]